MSRHINCSSNCCHQMECCPRGIKEHMQNYLHQRHNPKEYRSSFVEYWWWEFKSLIGLNRVSDLELDDLDDDTESGKSAQSPIKKDR